MIIAPIIEAIKPALDPSGYKPRKRPPYVASNEPAIPNAAVTKKPAL